MKVLGIVPVFGAVLPDAFPKLAETGTGKRETVAADHGVLAVVFLELGGPIAIGRGDDAVVLGAVADERPEGFDAAIEGVRIRVLSMAHHDDVIGPDGMRVVVAGCGDATKDLVVESIGGTIHDLGLVETDVVKPLGGLVLGILSEVGRRALDDRVVSIDPLDSPLEGLVAKLAAMGGLEFGAEDGTGFEVLLILGREVGLGAV